MCKVKSSVMTQIDPHLLAPRFVAGLLSVKLSYVRCGFRVLF
jgi:hypothetical protein